MAIKVKNLSTGEVHVITGIRVVNGQIVPKKENLGERFVKSHAAELTACYDEQGKQSFVVNDGYELTKTHEAQPRPRREKPAQENTTEAQPTQENPVEVEEAQPAQEAQPTPAPQPTIEAPKTEGLNDALSAVFAPIFANVAKQIEANIRAEVKSEIDALKARARTHVTRIELVTEGGERHEVEGVFCEDFEDIVNDVNAGYYPYLWGAAGSGKSHTAEQIAKALGLDFYAQTMLNFAHEVQGYGDAGGNYVETSFFKAFTQGGLFFLDEADRSACEGLVVLNTALANRKFNFPVVGSVEAHPNFRFICAGNTTMSGADEEYTSGQVQDASFKNRLVFYEMQYDRRVELPVMAQGDEVLVDFVEDVRRAIKNTGTLHVVSYRETAYMKAHEANKEKALIRSTFKGLDIDIVRQVYGALSDKQNVWAKALANVVANAQ